MWYSSANSHDDALCVVTGGARCPYRAAPSARAPPPLLAGAATSTLTGALVKADHVPMMTPHDRFLACMRYDPVDHIPLHEWGPWPSARRRWQREGLGEGNAPPQYAEADARLPCGVDLWMLPRFEERVIAEDELTVNQGYRPRHRAA